MGKVVTYKRDDICICTYRYKKKIDGKWKMFNNSLVRIISPPLRSKFGDTYKIYNITLERYDEISHVHLNLDKKSTRYNRLEKILNG
jgi:hypothetical protein